MNIVQACEHILGASLARNMIADPTLGLNWCVIAAMTEATTAHSPQAIAAIKAHNAELKASVRLCDTSGASTGGDLA